MTILFRRIRPVSFPITIDIIAKFLGIPQSAILRVENWSCVVFVHRSDRGGQFISYRKLAMWLEAIVTLIRNCHSLKQLKQVGLWIKQECIKFKYYNELILEYLRSVWIERRDIILGRVSFSKVKPDN